MSEEWKTDKKRGLAWGSDRLVSVVRLLSLVFALLAFPLAAQADYFIEGEGREQPFCEAILAALNSNRPTEEHRPCISEVVLKIPGVKDPDWEKLDLSQHEQIAMEMMTLGVVGSTEYFREKKLAPHMYPTQQRKLRMLEIARQGGAEMFTLRLAPEFFGDNVLLTLRYQAHGCGAPFDLRGEHYAAAWVSLDLKKIAGGPRIVNSLAGRPLMYRGRLYLMRPYGSARSLEIYVPGHGYLNKVCNINFTNAINFKADRK
jgi:hypothetical protein